MSEKGGNDLEVGRAPSQTTSEGKEVAEAANAQIDWTPEEETKLVRRSVGSSASLTALGERKRHKG